jgi:tetratricopeptide (TPR) repeat protein
MAVGNTSEYQATGQLNCVSKKGEVMRKIYSFLLVIVFTEPLLAQEMNCDLLAASPSDPQKTVLGVSYEKLNVTQAVPACKQAVEMNPRVGRLWFQYGRALEKANKLPDAIVAYQEAIKLNSGAANNNIGELYRDGKGFQKDLKKAEEYFTKAVELKSPEGKVNLANLKKISQSIIPSQFIGSWAESKTQCREYKATISGDEIYSPYNETLCKVRSTGDNPRNVFLGKFSCKNAVVARTPYPNSTETHFLKLNTDGSLSSDIFDNQKPLVRCD